MYAVRLWSIRHAGFWEGFYRRFEHVFLAADPVLRRIGFGRLERPVAAVERSIKGLLFDCQMCGQCVLSSTGMSCPMNCPKQMRNGPCGGVRPDGHCEVRPDMRCVWVQAWEGSRRMIEGDRIAELRPPVDHRRRGSSSWLGVLRERRG
ncbi:MAG: methylenetetrahydrofolate reductase C-terminal domain-containing protein [Geminicoccaceae bacterium]